MAYSIETSEVVVEGETLPLITFAGDLDVATADAVHQAGVEVLGSVPPGGLMVDLSGLTFIDSRGVATLLDIRRLLGGRPMYLRGVPSRRLDSLLMMGVDRQFEFLPRDVVAEPDDAAS